jgi:hypothetical protein
MEIQSLKARIAELEDLLMNRDEVINDLYKRLSKYEPGIIIRHEKRGG